MMPTRVFVSSVIEGFEEYRAAAKAGILAAHGEPVLTEDFPSLPVSSRNACLDGIASCDIYIVIVGNRGGWTTPSGKLVVEEEYEEARRLRMPILGFLQNVQRDEITNKFVNKISDYIEGTFRLSFNTPSELKLAVKKSLTPIIQQHKKPEVNPVVFESKMGNPYKTGSDAFLRIVAAPKLAGEFIDPIALEGLELRNEIFTLGHQADIGLFSYESSKSTEVGVNEIIIIQSEENHSPEIFNVVRLEISTQGVITIDINVTGTPKNDVTHDFHHHLLIFEDDIANGLKKTFSFIKEFLDKKDPYKRYDPILYNASLCGLGSRTLTSDRSRRNSYSIGMHENQIIGAYDEPRIINRADITNPEQEILRVISLFRRRLRS